MIEEIICGMKITKELLDAEYKKYSGELKPILKKNNLKKVDARKYIPWDSYGYGGYWLDENGDEIKYEY